MTMVIQAIFFLIFSVTPIVSETEFLELNKSNLMIKFEEFKQLKVVLNAFGNVFLLQLDRHEEHAMEKVELCTKNETAFEAKSTEEEFLSFHGQVLQANEKRFDFKKSNLTIFGNAKVTGWASLMYDKGKMLFF